MKHQRQFRVRPVWLLAVIAGLLAVALLFSAPAFSEANSAPAVAAQNQPAVQQPAPADSSAPTLEPNTSFTLTFPDLPPTFDELGNPRENHAMLMRMGGVPLVKGKCYEISFRIRSSELRQPVGVDIQDTNGWKHSGLNKSIRPGADWTQGRFCFKNQNDMGDTARLDFAFLQPGHIDVADVKVVGIAAVPADRNGPAEVVNPTNLVTNGDFSAVADGKPTGWGTAGNKNNVDQVLTAEKDADGKPFARVTCTRLEHRGPGNKPMITVYLPKNYDTMHKFPLLVFLEGGTGGLGDKIGIPRALAQDKDFICVNMPLFKEAEAAKNQRYLLIDDPDAKFAWAVYKKMLVRLDETVPNIDPAHRIIGGFSNGGHTTKGIINQSEGEATTYFTAFYLVEGGAGLDRFDLLKGKPLFILYGAKNGGAWADRLFKAANDADVKAKIFAMPNVGHDFSREGQAAVRKWLHETVLGESATAEMPAAAEQPVPVSTEKSATEAGAAPRQSAGKVAAMDTLKTFAELMKSAGISEQGEEPMTFFAPTDAAFAAMPKDRLDALKKDPKAAKDLLLNLMVNKYINPMSLPSAGKMQTLGGGMLTVSPVKASPSDTGPLGLAMVNDAKVLERIPVSQGRRIYALDKVVFARKPAASEQPTPTDRPTAEPAK